MTIIYTQGKGYTETASICDLYKEGYYFDHEGDKVYVKVGYTDNGRTFTASHVFVKEQITAIGNHVNTETIELGKNPYFEVSEFTVSKFPENLKTRILEHLKNASTNEIVSYWNTYCASICEDNKRIEYMEDLPDRFYDVKVPELYKLVRPNTRFNLCDELWSYDYAGFIRSFWADDIMEYINLDDLVDDMIEHSEDYQFYDNLKAIFKKYENEAKGV